MVAFAFCNAGLLPISYSSVTLHPHHIFHSEFKESDWKTPVEWKKSEEWHQTPIEWKESEKPVSYDFKYDVHDEKTGDIKRQSESANHGTVKGQYSLIDSDGYKRIVDYTADDHHQTRAIRLCRCQRHCCGDVADLLADLAIDQWPTGLDRQAHREIRHGTHSSPINI